MNMRHCLYLEAALENKGIQYLKKNVDVYIGYILRQVSWGAKIKITCLLFVHLNVILRINDTQSNYYLDSKLQRNNLWDITITLK